MENIVDVSLFLIIILLFIGLVYQLFSKKTNENFGNDNIPLVIPKKKILKSEKRKINKKNKKKVHFEDDLIFIEISENGESIGKIIIKLFADIVPITCKNFRELCNKKKYVNCPFHRIIKDFMIQGGDYTRGNGTGGMSIYGESFEDENFEIPHDQPYLLSMANAGPNTNGSQFFITTSECPHLDGKHVVFGRVVKGFDIIDYLNNVETNGNDKPLNDIRILNCGQI
ncbi:cyclophilin type peptidyl-prolyl cis-trans isomerase [Catovirus CTV1]|uniref:peptidylprolyl isomerase n=1 Tax=Catovirus CTV1 TaxID=1977631 RepID=A0A1V0S9I2_9VIRU|nr:cyclophilin type peptidyl-prolyl cis-trans isomerase [Catovirus CTV1]